MYFQKSVRDTFKNMNLLNKCLKSAIIKIEDQNPLKLCKKCNEPIYDEEFVKLSWGHHTDMECAKQLIYEGIYMSSCLPNWPQLDWKGSILIDDIKILIKDKVNIIKYICI